LPLALVCAASSCSDPLTPPRPGELLFEIEASGQTETGPWWIGYSITADGGVYSYNSGPNAIPIPTGDVYTAAQLKEKYAQDRRYRAQLPDGETLSHYDAAIGELVRSPLTEAKPACPDLTVQRFYVLVYDSHRDQYTRVLLHALGGIAQVNTAPTEHDLYLWLRDITRQEYLGPTDCDPYP
jgi:hypothetical protein